MPFITASFEIVRPYVNKARLDLRAAWLLAIAVRCGLMRSKRH